MNLKSLENIVPPLALCKKAAEKFPDSWKRDFAETALCHEEAFWCEHYNETTGEDNSRNEHRIVVREQGNKDMKCQSAGIVLTSAPTSDEILTALPPGSIIGNDGDKFFAAAMVGKEYLVKTGDTSSIAALLLWFRINEKEVQE